MNKKYKQGDLKIYNHWILSISFRQHTLGSFIIIAKRKLEKISELDDNEILELKYVMNEMEQILLSHKEFKPDRFNYLQLGNKVNQLHFHGIPRYSSPRQFAGKEWIDTTFGSPPIFLKTNQESNLILVKKIKTSLRNGLSKLESKITHIAIPSDKNLMEIYYKKAKELIIKNQKASVTFIQRKLWIDFHRATQIMKELENNGVVGPDLGASPRKILVKE